MSASTTRDGSFDAQPIGLIAANLTGSKLGRRTRALLSRGDSPRSGEPVWRNSYYVGQKEHQIWKPINGGGVRAGKRWTAAILKAAKAFELRTRALRRETDPGARNGALGEIGIAVLEYLYQVVDYASGTLEPAIRTIAETIGRAYSAVHAALVRLRQHDFLRWLRRSRPVENPEPGGPRVEQASNAYALLVPEKMRSWLSRLIGNAPTPECEEDRGRRKREELEAMIGQLTATENAIAHHDHPVLGDVLRGIAAAVDRREAQEGESSGSDETGGSYRSKKE